jgi:hypothetical protein
MSAFCLCSLYDLADLILDRLERLAAERRRAVDLSQWLTVSLLGRPQIALLLHAVEEWVQAAGAYAIPMPRKLFDHAEPKDRFLNGVVQNVNPDEPRVQVPGFGQVVWLLLRRHSQNDATRTFWSF